MKSNAPTPHFSIITVVRDAAATIENCLDSVRAQGPRTEHIVIDGCSTDGTLDILQARAANGEIRLLSERDNGIYDAMNKGLRLVRGQIVGILNADDIYANSQVLNRVGASLNNTSFDAVYGDLVYVERHDVQEVVRYWRSGDYRRGAFLSGWMPPHPTFFARRSIYERYGLFRTDLGSAADYELMLRLLYKHSVRATYVPHILVRMRLGGASNVSIKRRLMANRMDKRAWDINNLEPRPWTLIAKPLRKITQYLATAPQLP